MAVTGAGADAASSARRPSGDDSSAMGAAGSSRAILGGIEGPASTAAISERSAADSPHVHAYPPNEHTSRPQASYHHYPHHPYRLEVTTVTPVSVLLLWSIRPPPVSAIPRNANAASKNANGCHDGSALPSSRSLRDQSKRKSGDARRHLISTSTVTATRGPNRKVTKVTLSRSTSPGKTLDEAGKVDGAGHQRVASGSPVLSRDSPLSRRKGEDWSSDEEATVVNDDDVLADNAALDLDTRTASNAETVISVDVNGIPWRQVVLSYETSEDERFIAVYGLTPGRRHDIVLAIKGDKYRLCMKTPDYATSDVRDAVSGDSSRELAHVEAGASLDDDGHAPRIHRTHTPPMQDTGSEALAPTDGTQSLVHVVQNDSATQHTNAAVSNGSSASALQASIRKARKDASRAESAMRHEIEAIKRGLDRMSDVDHRSKQKLLALQESIRQATMQTKTIDEEARVVEDERQEWEARDHAKGEELEAVRQESDEKMRASDMTMKSDSEELASLEKDLARASKALEDKRALKDQLTKEKIAEQERELTRIQSEIDKVLKQSSLPYAQNATESRSFNQHTAPFATSSASSSGGHANASSGPSYHHVLSPQPGSLRGGRLRGSAAPPRGAPRMQIGGPPTWRGSNHGHGPQVRSAPYGGNFPMHGPNSSSHASDEPHQMFPEHISPSVHHSLLNPNKPEFVPGAGYVTSSSLSPLQSVSRPEFSPLGTNRTHLNAGPEAFLQAPDSYDDDGPDRSSSSFFSASGPAQLGASESMSNASPSVWSTAHRNTTALPWNSTAISALASGSPHSEQDIWSVGAHPSPQQRSSPFHAGLAGTSAPPPSSSPNTAGSFRSPNPSRLGISLAHTTPSASSFESHNITRSRPLSGRIHSPFAGITGATDELDGGVYSARGPLDLDGEAPENSLSTYAPDRGSPLTFQSSVP